MKLLILQLCLPPYRVGFIESLLVKVPDLLVLAGRRHFKQSIQTVKLSKPWLRIRDTKYIIKRRFALQSTINYVDYFRFTDVAVSEWNPRILTYWIDLVILRAQGSKVLLWGHMRGAVRGNIFIRILYRIMVEAADGIVCYYDTEAHAAKRLFPGKYIIAAPNACLHASNVRVSSDVGRNLIIYVGRLSKDKEVDMLITAFSIYRKRLGGKYELGLVGPSSCLEEFQELARCMEVMQETHFLGEINNEDALCDIYARSAYSVSPGYVGLSLIQGLCFGVPALVSFGRDHSPEIHAVKENVNAFFFKAGDPVDLALLMLRCQNIEFDHCRRVQLSDSNINKYSFERMAEQYSKIMLGDNGHIKKHYRIL